MSKRLDDKSIAKLVKKLSNQQSKKRDMGKTYDPTAPSRVDEDQDNQKFFKEMKRREF